MEDNLTAADLSSAETIGEYAFVNNKNLTTLKLNEKGADIAEGAFAYAAALANVENLGKAKNIGDYAFAYTSIVNIDLSETETVGTQAFIRETLTPVTVTLGKDIAEGGRLRPISVEKPICFATFLMQCAMVGQMKSEVTNKLSELNQKIEKYDSSSWIGKLIKPRPRQLSEEQKQVLLNMIQEHESDLNDLRNEINMLPLFINGEKQEWID